MISLWIVEKSKGKYTRVVANLSQEPICMCEVKHAALIAAAPEMLGCLEDLVEAIDRDNRAGLDSEARNFVLAAQTAITKATGGNSQ